MHGCGGSMECVSHRHAPRHPRPHNSQNLNNWLGILAIYCLCTPRSRRGILAGAPSNDGQQRGRQVIRIRSNALVETGCRERPTLHRDPSREMTMVP